MRIPAAWWLVAVSLVIAGCGGGGGGGTCTSNCVTSVLSVSAVTPANMATGVAITSTVTATFDMPMTASTLTTSTFTVTPQGGSATSGTVSYSSANDAATFTPAASLAYNTTYTATITTGAQSTAGTSLTSNYTWSFTTAPGPAPTVTAVMPANTSTGVAISSTVTATFSEAMNASTITGSTFTLTPQGGSAVAANVSYAANVATLTPTLPLANNTTYTATITTGVQSSSGSALAANYTWTFTTVAATAQPPSVTSVTPANGSTTAAINTTLTATFNEAMDPTTITGSTFTLTGPGNASVQGNVSYNAGTSVATLTPTGNLFNNTLYTATISTSVMSSGEVPLTALYTWSFTTVAATPPTVTTTVPANGATGVNVGNALTATFSQPMNSATLTASTVTLTGPGNTAVSGLISYNTGTSTVTFAPSSALAYNTSYTATITTGAQSSAGAALASPYVWTFTTGASPNQVTVDFGTTYQTIRGFGGSTAWLGQLTAQQATALFSPTICTGSNSTSCGLGLSILRMRIDPSGSAGSNYVTNNWTQELANAQAAEAANPNAIVFGSPWTPPVGMKNSSTSQPYTSGCSPADTCGGYLDPSHYADYANYLEDFVTYFKNNGVNLYAISMQNEPDYANVTYESCYWTPQQMDTWVASLTLNGVTNPITTKLIMPESFQFIQAQSNPTLADPNAVGNVSIIGGHLYGVSPSYYAAAINDGKDIWMTEHATCESNCPADTIADALASAEEVHNSMTVGFYNAYVWWWTWDNPADGINYGLINSSTTNPAPTFYGYGIGQFSEFIQPGFVRVSATATPVAGVYVSAYSNTSPAHCVIVAINSNTTSESLFFVLNNGSGVTSLTPYQSTSAAGLAAQTAVSVSGGQFSYTLPAQSIVTFYQ